MISCLECKYHQLRKESEELGVCVKYAPRPVSVIDREDDDDGKPRIHSITAFWPSVFADDGCGEGEKK